MISGIFILNHKGESILFNRFRQDVSLSAAELFRINVINQRGYYVPTPVNQFDKYHYCHTFVKEGLWFVAVSTKNINVALCFEFLNRIKTLVWNYCGVYSEITVQKKCVLLTEVIEEICDYGIPQLTDFNGLKPLLTQSRKKIITKSMPIANMTNQVTGQITWRAPNIKYKFNELFITVMEKVNIVVSTTGQPLNMSVDGVVGIKAFLTGMPECKCGINDKIITNSSNTSKANSNTHIKQIVALDDCSFHQCVRLGTYEQEHSISFVPPDGKFELMRYRTTQDVLVPFRIIPLIKESSPNTMEITMVLKSVFKPQLVATNIEVIVPIPYNTSKVTTDVFNGKAIHNKEDNCIVWRIKNMQGSKEYQFSANIETTATSALRAKKEGRPPISMKFEVPFSCSGMRIRYVKVFEPKFNYNDNEVSKWVRYITQEGKFEFRI